MFFEILSEPVSNSAPSNYRGLYRKMPGPQPKSSERFLTLWYRYIDYDDTKRGITTELTISELKELAELLTQSLGAEYEVIFFSESHDCPAEALFYGYDVTGIGKYSIIGDGTFSLAKGKNSVINIIPLDEARRVVSERLNQFGLFDSLEDANVFLSCLREINRISPNYIEQEEWRISSIYKLI